MAPICDGDIRASTHVWASLWISNIAGLHMVIVFFVVHISGLYKNVLPGVGQDGAGGGEVTTLAETAGLECAEVGGGGVAGQGDPDCSRTSQPTDDLPHLL